MEGKGKERERGEASGTTSFRLIRVANTLFLSPTFPPPLLSHPRSNRAKREGFAIDSSTRVVEPSSDSPADVRHKGFLDD